MATASQIIKLTEDTNLTQCLEGENRLVIFYLVKTHCPACISIESYMRQLSMNYDRYLVIVKVDIQQTPDFVAGSTISAVPAFLFYKKGQWFTHDVIAGVNIPLFESKISHYLAL